MGLIRHKQNYVTHWSIPRSHLTGHMNDTSSDWLVGGQEAVVSALKRQYLQNDYFAGGFGLMLVGFLANFFRKYWAQFWEYVSRRRGIYVVYVKPDEEAFQWLQEWLCQHATKDSSQLTLQTKWGLPSDRPDDYGDGGSQRDSTARPRLLFLPQLLEAQTIIYEGQKVVFQIQRKIGAANKGEADGGDLATLLQSAGGKEQLVIEGPTRDVLEAVIHDAMETYFKKEEGTRKTTIKRWNAQEYYWNVVATRLARPLNSVVLDCDVEGLVADARQFLGSYNWYNDRGIPHRRGYILYGPPGCGKTSLIQALAGELGLDVAMVGLSSKEMSDDMLHTAMNRCDTHSILVLEDVDAAFTNKRTDGNEKHNGLSFSGLLNAIDGISAQEGRLLVMTTNHLHRLDPALIRPGRVDLRLFIGLCSRLQLINLFLKFYPEASQSEANKFATQLPEGTISPAMIQGYFLMHRDNSVAAIQRVEDLLQQHKEEEDRVAAREHVSLEDSAAARQTSVLVFDPADMNIESLKVDGDDFCPKKIQQPLRLHPVSGHGPPSAGDDGSSPLNDSIKRSKDKRLLQKFFSLRG
eukprot:jgi/Mesen1/6139/ME000313S05260